MIVMVTLMMKMLMVRVALLGVVWVCLDFIRLAWVRFLLLGFIT